MSAAQDFHATRRGLIRSGQPRTLVGYGWPWTVRAGETIEFKVSAHAEGAYQADLVRIICADDLSDRAMFKEQEIEAPFAGTYAGRFQATYAGSYVEIEAPGALDRLQSFTVQAFVFPTALPKTAIRRLPTPLASPHKNQHLVSRWAQSAQRGWALLIDEHNRAAFQLGVGERVQRLSLPRALIENRWFQVLARYDAEHRRIGLDVRLVSKAAGELLAWPASSVQERIAEGISCIQDGPLRFAAAANGMGHGSRLEPAGCFNGRLDRVRLCVGILNDDEAKALAGTQIPQHLHERVVGFWDFSHGIETIHIHDQSDNALHGVAVNLPTRAVAGVNWDGSVDDWRARPDIYSAIHFHDDDLYDAEWQTDFRYRIPQDLSSGIYAARLRHERSEEYIPFFVAPPKSITTARVALLLSTTTYLAYANVCWLKRTLKKRISPAEGGRSVVEEAYPWILRKQEDEEFLDRQLRERSLGKGMYLHHTDGTLCAVASQKYPNLSIKPKTRNWTLVADTYITDWLERLGIAYDVITDDLVQNEGAELLERYPVVMTGNHPEYCSAQLLDAIGQYQQQGGRLMYLGGNGFFWVASYHKQLPGTIELRKEMSYAGIHPPYELRHAFDGQRGGLWSHNGRPAQLLVGVGSVFPLPFAGSAPYQRLPASHDRRASFIFEGVTQEIFGDYGIIGGGAAGQETDEFDAVQGTPAHALHLARSCDFPWPMSGLDGLTAEEYRENVKMPRADLVFFEGPQGGAVFSVGSMAWVGALSHNHYDNDIARITENVLRRFLDKTPFRDPACASECGVAQDMTPCPA